MIPTRTEHDSFGPRQVPSEPRWGALPLQSPAHFEISGERMPEEFIFALATVKAACAPVYRDRARLAAARWLAQ